MFAIHILPAEISRAEKLLGITTKSLQMSRQLGRHYWLHSPTIPLVGIDSVSA